MEQEEQQAQQQEEAQRGRQTTRRPAVSVLVAVYNGAAFLRPAIDSILSQTFSDFELIIINDGSTDDTEAIITGYRDERIRYFRNERNLGLTVTLNAGMEQAAGRYIARMDADDISLPERLRKQYDYMETHPDVAVCGSKAYTIGEGGKRTGALGRVTGPDNIKAQLLFGNRFIHSSAFFRSDILKIYKYNPDFRYSQDFELFVRIAAGHLVENLDEFLVQYREHRNNITHTRLAELAQIRRRIFLGQLEDLLGSTAAGELIDVHLTLCDWKTDRYPLIRYRQLLEVLKTGNQRVGKYNPDIFNKVLYDMWYGLVRVKAGKKSLQFFSTPLFERSFLTFKQVRKLLKQAAGIR